jgi:hypothetical protein
LPKDKEEMIKDSFNPHFDDIDNNLDQRSKSVPTLNITGAKEA